MLYQGEKLQTINKMH